MSGSKYTNYYIADGFAEDCEEIIQKFLKTETTSYQVFCNIWKDMKFTDVFRGRITKAEVAELSEEMLIIAKQFMVAPSNNFEESVAGLFVLYGIAHTQPFERFAPVRFIPEDVDCIMRIKEEATTKKRWDVVYILGSLLIEGPSEFHIAQRPYGLDRPLRKYFEDKMSVQSEIYQKGVMHKHCKETQTLRDLSSAMMRYNIAKINLPCELSVKLHNYIDLTLPSQLERSLKILVGEETAPKETPVEDDHDVRTAIRNRAMKGTVGKLKFLNTVNNAYFGTTQPKSLKGETKRAWLEGRRMYCSVPGLETAKIDHKSDTEVNETDDEGFGKQGAQKSPSPKKKRKLKRSPRKGRKRILSKAEDEEPETSGKSLKVSKKPNSSSNKFLLDRPKDNDVELDLNKFI